jgi:hypothetical protein
MTVIRKLYKLKHYADKNAANVIINMTDDWTFKPLITEQALNFF